MTIIVYPSAEALARATAGRLLTEIGDALASNGVAHVVVTGGRTGTAILAQVAESPMRDDVDWTSVHIWWSDERFVPAGDSERNDRLAHSVLLGQLELLPRENVHAMGHTDSGRTATETAAAYASELASLGDPAPVFDVALLGVGEDGHVASLFPGHPSTHAAGTVVAVEGAPKLPPTRISLTAVALARSRQVWLLAAGADKADAVARGIAGDPTVPAGSVRGAQCTLWLVDAAAASAV